MAKKYYKMLCGNKSHSSPIYVEYNIGEWTHAPKGTLLFVFNTDKNLTYTNSYECEVRRPQKAFKVRATVLHTNEIKTYWEVDKKARSQKKNINNALTNAGFFILVPDGTVMCNAVKLTKRIQ